METKFTKGEWMIIPKAMGGVMEKDSERTIASCMGYSSNINQESIYQENIANAKLIATAPEMFKALEKSIDILENTLEIVRYAEPSFYLEIKEQITQSKQILKKATE